MKYLGDFSVYRTELMGVATLMILVCHIVAYVPMPMSLYYILAFCDIGVDIFLFLSGMGIWYSIDNKYVKKHIMGG